MIYTVEWQGVCGVWHWRRFENYIAAQLYRDAAIAQGKTATIRIEERGRVNGWVLAMSDALWERSRS